jgi:hypothetical protein
MPIKQPPGARALSTSQGRQRFPELIQDTYGHQSITMFTRYGRTIGGMISMDAVQMLIDPGSVDPDVRARIQKNAQEALKLLGE